MIKLLCALCCSTDAYNCFLLLPKGWKILFLIIIANCAAYAILSIFATFFGWAATIIGYIICAIVFYTICILTAKDMEE